MAGRTMEGRQCDRGLAASTLNKQFERCEMCRFSSCGSCDAHSRMEITPLAPEYLSMSRAVGQPEKPVTARRVRTAVNLLIGIHESSSSAFLGCQITHPQWVPVAPCRRTLEPRLFLHGEQPGLRAFSDRAHDLHEP